MHRQERQLLNEEGANPPINLEIAQKIWREFKWSLPGELNNKETIQYCLEEIFREFPSFFEGSSPEQLMNELSEKRKQMIALYREIFPKEQKDEPFYHNINEDEEWSDHVGLVMASSARLFLGMLKIQRNLKNSGENENLSLKKKLEDKFGKNWLEANFTLVDLKKSLAIALGHEAGEWWARGYWREALDSQRQEVDMWKNGNLDKKDIQKLETHAKNYRKNNFFKYFRNVGKTKRFAKGVEDVLGGYGIKVEMSVSNPTEFSVFFY